MLDMKIKSFVCVSGMNAIISKGVTLFSYLPRKQEFIYTNIFLYYEQFHLIAMTSFRMEIRKGMPILLHFLAQILALAAFFLLFLTLFQLIGKNFLVRFS